MRLKHHEIEVEFPEEWLAEIRERGFIPKTNSYRVLAPSSGVKSYEVAITEIAAVHRAPGVPTLKDESEKGTPVEERVGSILRAFRDDIPLPPVEVVGQTSKAMPKFKLTAGVHRLYCSMAVGFTHVPAVDGFDWASLDQ